MISGRKLHRSQFKFHSFILVPEVGTETWVQIPVLSLTAVYHSTGYLTSVQQKWKIRKNHLLSQLWELNELRDMLCPALCLAQLAASVSARPYTSRAQESPILSWDGCSLQPVSPKLLWFSMCSRTSRRPGPLSRVPLLQNFTIPRAKQSRKGPKLGEREPEPGSGARKGACCLPRTALQHTAWVCSVELWSYGVQGHIYGRVGWRHRETDLGLTGGTT